jgi:hypothetical protein
MPYTNPLINTMTAHHQQHWHFVECGQFRGLDSAMLNLSDLLCVGGIAGLALQNTAQMVSGEAGVAFGIISILDI